jgi:ribosomal protein L11 methyltransferase
VPSARAEPARGAMLKLFPEGFEEDERGNEVELVAYTDAAGEERLRAVFEGATSDEVAADWADRWRRFHRPVEVGRLWVGPPWEPVPPEAVAVVVDPGRAFGTGGHATTRLCLELLLGLEPSSLVDLGCGSGVLAIAAAKLGFAPVFGVDREEQAVEATRANSEANGVHIEVRRGDILADDLPEVETVVANVDLNTVTAAVPRVPARVAIVSGYLMNARPSLAGFGHAERRERDGWAADRYMRE